MREQFGSVVRDDCYSQQLPPVLEGPVGNGFEGHNGFLTVMFCHVRDQALDIDYVSADRLLRYVGEQELEAAKTQLAVETAAYHRAGVMLFDLLQTKSDHAYAGKYAKY